jgi:hypothetical protein
MKRWLASIGHTLHLTWLEVEEGKNPGTISWNK